MRLSYCDMRCQRAYRHGRPQGRARGGTCPPLACQNSMFFAFFEENSIFLGVFQANSMFLPPPEKFCPPLEKSLRTPMLIVFRQAKANSEKLCRNSENAEK